jgi:hypothetical protein
MSSFPEPQDPAAAHADHLPPAPPNAPRELTPAVRRRSWTERHVRIWSLLAFAMTAIAAYYAISRYYFWSQETRLIEHGEMIQAEIMGWAPGMDAPRLKVVSATDPVDIQYTYKGQTYRSFSVLGGRAEQIVTRTTVPIFIDPANPARWTARIQPASLIHEMLSAMLLVPFAVVLFALALIRRRQVLTIYRDGEVVLAEVVGLHHSAAAPFSRLLRCAVHVGQHVRVIKILLPAHKAPDTGQPLWLIAPPNRADQAIPAALFE